ncbi:hypothetical protein BdWA1_002419 [Babesia duncani]|uniref:Uncharacterized protein n=1 Tax=Babesia duncani TaxID=323732 RepID=A0AAD9PJ45_9APIC|nr:hypothetical protein BdWA1_002419 [Babesia duncani]
MTELDNRGSLLDEESVYPLHRYRNLIGLFLSIYTFQIGFCFIFYGIGGILSWGSFHDHICAFYGLAFGLFIIAIESNYFVSIKSAILDVVPSLENDIIKYAFYFMVGIPGIFDDDSFQYQFGCILLTILGLVGSFVSFRYQRVMQSYISVAGFTQAEP